MAGTRGNPTYIRDILVQCYEAGRSRLSAEGLPRVAYMRGVIRSHRGEYPLSDQKSVLASAKRLTGGFNEVFFLLLFFYSHLGLWA